MASTTTTHATPTRTSPRVDRGFGIDDSFEVLTRHIKLDVTNFFGLFFTFQNTHVDNNLHSITKNMMSLRETALRSATLIASRSQARVLSSQGSVAVEKLRGVFEEYRSQK